MIRQKKNRAYLQKSSFKLDSCMSYSENTHPPQQKTIRYQFQMKPEVFQDGILNKFFKQNSIGQNPLNFSLKGKRKQLIRSKIHEFTISGQKINNCIFNKQNFVEEKFEKPQSRSKLLLLQTTGNGMFSLRNYKRKENKLKQKRPYSAISSCRASFKSECFDNSLSRVLEELSQNNFSKTQQKISTSKALVMFSKVIRSNENSSRQLFQKRIRTNSKQKYKSVNILANKVKIESKQRKGKPKMEFKTYLQRFNLIGGRQNGKLAKQKPPHEDFSIQGWQTGSIEIF